MTTQTSNFPNASLYVGDLHESITEQQLYDIFREMGPIVSIRVCRDAVTRKSLGYAYVNFQNPDSADRAIDALNYTPVKGRPIRIMWSQRDPSVRKSGIGNIFIKNLDKAIDNKLLYDTFSNFGNILSCKVATKGERTVNKETGEMEDKTVSRGYGFVHFETQEAAEEAIAKVNGMLLNGKQVYVGPFIKRHERIKPYNLDEKYTNVYVKNLDKSVTSQELITMFSEFGTIQHAQVMEDDQGKSKGFGFVNFESHEAAKNAVDAINNKEIKGKKVFCGRAQRKAERLSLLKDLIEKKKIEKQTKYATGANLYVKNLDDSIDDEKLKELFGKFGPISNTRIMRDEKDNASRGFGFVCYEKPEDAQKAINEMNGRIVGSKPLYVAVAQKKEIRRQQLEAQYRSRAFGQGMPQGMPMPVYPPYNAAPRFMPHPMMGPRRGPYQAAPMMGAPPVQGGNKPMPYAQAVISGGRGINASSVQGRGVPAPQRGGRGGQRGGHASNRGGYKFNNNARNARPAPQMPPQGAPFAAYMAPPPHMDDGSLTLSNLAEFPPEAQKNIIGDRLFPLVMAQTPELAGKVTGMLLEMEISDLLHLLETEEALNAKIQEAIAVLQGQAQNE